MCLVAYQRDPLSRRFDGLARELIGRAYRVRGEWAGAYVPPPGPRAWAWMLANGIYSPYERDRWGEIRWIRAYKRAVFWNVNWYGGVSGLRGQANTGAGSGGWHAPVRVEWQTGIRVERPGWTAARWAVRMRIHPGGAKTSRIGLERAERLGENWIDRDGRPTFRQSLPDDRPWERAG
jgi:hypothetical protein